MDSKKIAGIILQQLGGNKFIAMTGPGDLFALSATEEHSGGFVCKFRGSKRANYITIRLNGMDTYDVEFKKIWGCKIKDVSEHQGIYEDMLQDLFTQETGLDTHL